MTNQLRRRLRYALSLLLGKPILDSEIFSLPPSKLAHLLPKCIDENCHAGSRARIQVPDAEDFSLLLGFGEWRAQRTKRRAYRERVLVSALAYPLLHFALSHLITLSALASTFGGIVRPICFAVFKLIMNSNFVGCSTGRSAGFAPLRILSTNVAARCQRSKPLGP